MLTGAGKYTVIANKSGGRSFEVRAFDGSQMMGTRLGASGGFGTTGTATIGNYEKDLLEGFVNTSNDTSMRRMYRDIYYHDPIAGSAVDLQSELPFSEFTLSGLPEQQMLQIFAKSIEALNVKTLLPELTRDYQVEGAFVAALNFDNESRSFTSIMPQNLDFCQITPLPMYGRDPLIDIKIPDYIKDLFKKGDARVKKAFEKYGDDWIEMIKQDIYKLDPDSTLYIPRRTFSTSPVGVSLFRRLLPVWIMEKALLRGTIDLSYRRQKAILHAMAGDEEWEPTNEELQRITQMVINADADPTGAVIATRPGIMFNEIRAGNDFWRYDEMYDFFSGVKMRALGISEAFLGGDATYNNMETSLSVFIEQIRSFREMITRKVFYTRLFPLIAQNNEYTVDRYKKRDRQETTGSLNEISNSGFYTDSEGNHFYTTSNHTMVVGIGEHEEIDTSQLLMPKLQWHKQLKPEADESYLSLLSTAEEKGLPIPMRIWAAATGLSLPEIMTSLDEDISIRKRIDKYQKQKPKSAQEAMEGMFSEAGIKGGGNLPLKKNRNFDSIEARDPQTGRILTKKGLKVISERNHKVAARALANIARRDNAQENEKQKRTRKRLYSYSTQIFGNTEN